MTSRNNGFTLIEMMVVIVVLGLVMALLANYGPWQNRWLQTKAEGGAIAAAMTQDRGRAIASGRPVRLALPKLPDWLVTVVTAPAGAIVFEPDGSATGGTVSLEDGSRTVIVTADWLTGRVSVDEP